MPNRRPRLRNSLESVGSGPITPYAPSGATVPNIGGSSATQSAHQVSSFLVAADTMRIVVPVGTAQPSTGGTTTQTITFPNIPNTQLMQQSTVGLQRGQAGVFTASNNTYPLFLTNAKVISIYPAFACTLVVSSTVKDKSGVLHKNSYLPPGLTYTAFGLSVTINYFNVGSGVLPPSNIIIEVMGELIATFLGV